MPQIQVLKPQAISRIEAAWDKAGKKAYQKPLEQLTKDHFRFSLGLGFMAVGFVARILGESLRFWERRF